MPLDLSPEAFQRLTAGVAELATDYLRRLDSLPIRPDTSGAALEETFGGAAPETGRGEGVLALLRAWSTVRAPRTGGSWGT